MCAGSFFIALFYVFLLKWIVKPILYLSILLIQIIFIGLGVYCIMHSQDYPKDSEYYTYNINGGIVFFVIAFIYLCFVCCCMNNIRLGASIMECASEFIT